MSYSLPPTNTDARIESARIFRQTRSLISHKGEKSLILSSRGFERDGVVPMVQTSPILRKRRYTIDADEFKPVDQISVPNANSGWSFTFLDSPGPYPSDYDASKICIHETDYPAISEPLLALPKACRWPELKANCIPPCDTAMYCTMGDVSITNEEFLNIRVQTTLESWFTDSVLDIAFEFLKREDEGGGLDDYGIAIAPSLVSMILFNVGTNGPVTLDASELAHYKSERERFSNKVFIILPINDGMAGQEPVMEEAGTHWSFVLVNRLDGSARYFDSLFKHLLKYRQLAEAIATGLGNILGEEYLFSTDEKTPDQDEMNEHNDVLHNTCRDVGACGPFVVGLVVKFIQRIKKAQEKNTVEDLRLRVDKDILDGWQYTFQFAQLRYTLWSYCGRQHMAQEQLAAEKAHNDAALASLPHGVRALPVLPLPTIISPSVSNSTNDNARVIDLESEDTVEDDDIFVEVVSDDEDDYSSAVSSLDFV
ncbi:hypothetical protein EJ04DRAFT_560433 [Polyplosphaeria fusca]|uniref:Ubiquitin-like protease family profile domain-containing protein n=1 Tax=Polyplosphaeria fusca TaxID=682080 RepID=A0A9P4R436_9PLEO|nr:hypothetical protein EJ04DRAFT_560433 [Polyplosphaeria fusca]